MNILSLIARDAAARMEGAAAFQAGQTRADNPYVTLQPRVAVLTMGKLGDEWQMGWNEAAGLHPLARMTHEEAAALLARCGHERATYDATRDPAAAARTAARAARKRRAADRRRQERAAAICPPGFTLVAGPNGDRVVLA